MYIEIKKKLSSKQKLLLTYRGLPTFFILFSIFLAFIISFSLFHEYFQTENISSNTQQTKEVKKEIIDTSQNLAEQIHLREIEKLKKSEQQNKTIPPYFSLLTFVIPLFLLRKHYKKGNEIHSIISNGIITTSKLTNDEIIGGKDLTIHRLTFKYFSKNNTTAHFIKKVTRFTQKFQDETEELIIYHKNRTELAILVDDLPASISQHIKQNWL